MALIEGRGGVGDRRGGGAGAHGIDRVEQLGEAQSRDDGAEIHAVDAAGIAVDVIDLADVAEEGDGCPPPHCPAARGT